MAKDVAPEIEIEEYVTDEGKAPFSDWLDGLRDIRARAKIRVRLDRVEEGNFGDVEPVGDGVSELRIDYGPGYRVYFGKADKTMVLLLCGSTKKRQAKAIKLAKKYWTDYKGRD